MTDLVSGNAVIGQSGGPTAVINQSLAGVIEGLRTGLRATGKVKRIFGMRHGVRGLVKGGEDGLARSHAIRPRTKLERIARTPSAALGSTRDKPDEAYCEKILDGCRRTRHPLFLLYRRQRLGRHLPHRQREGGRRRLRAPLLPCAEDDRQRSPGERPHAGFPVRRALRDARADGRRARQCEPRRHQDQRHHGAERGLSHRRGVARPRRREQTARARRPRSRRI